jgi:hypothetical protein
MVGGESAGTLRLSVPKIGDLVRRRGCNWYAIVLHVEPETAEPRKRGYAKLYWIDEPPVKAVDCCHTSLLEVVSAS